MKLKKGTVILMKEIRYTYNTLGTYVTEGDTRFGEDTHLTLVVEPHDFSLKLGGETLRATSCEGYRIVVSCHGETAFCAYDGTPIATTPATDGTYDGVRLCWTPAALTVEFGHTEEVDNYPNCDGESDRWSTRWVTEHTATL